MKIKKPYNLILILTLIGVLVCSDFAYTLPCSPTLRPPSLFNKQSMEIIIKNALNHAVEIMKESGLQKGLGELSQFGSAGTVPAVVIRHKESGKGVMLIGEYSAGRSATARMLIKGIEDKLDPGPWEVVAHWQVVFLFVDNKAEQLFVIQDPLSVTDDIDFAWFDVVRKQDGALRKVLVREPDLNPTCEPVHIDTIVWIRKEDDRKNVEVEMLETDGPLREDLVKQVSAELESLSIILAEHSSDLIPGGEFHKMVIDINKKLIQENILPKAINSAEFEVLPTRELIELMGEFIHKDTLRAIKDELLFRARRNLPRLASQLVKALLDPEEYTEGSLSDQRRTENAKEVLLEFSEKIETGPVVAQLLEVLGSPKRAKSAKDVLLKISTADPRTVAKQLVEILVDPGYIKSSSNRKRAEIAEGFLLKISETKAYAVAGALTEALGDPRRVKSAERLLSEVLETKGKIHSVASALVKGLGTLRYAESEIDQERVKITKRLLLEISERDLSSVASTLVEYLPALKDVESETGLKRVEIAEEVFLEALEIGTKVEVVKKAYLIARVLAEALLDPEYRESPFDQKRAEIAEGFLLKISETKAYAVAGALTEALGDPRRVKSAERLLSEVLETKGKIHSVASALVKGLGTLRYAESEIDQERVKISKKFLLKILEKKVPLVVYAFVEYLGDLERVESETGLKRVEIAEEFFLESSKTHLELVIRLLESLLKEDIGPRVAKVADKILRSTRRLKHHNLLKEDAFEIVLEDGKKVNFIEISRRALDETFGENQWILSIGDSLVSLGKKDGKVLWVGANDINARVFVASNALSKRADLSTVFSRISEETGLPIFGSEELYLQLGKGKRLPIQFSLLQFDDLDPSKSNTSTDSYNPLDYYTGSLELLNEIIEEIPLEDIVDFLFDRYRSIYTRYSNAIIRDKNKDPIVIGNSSAQLKMICGDEPLRNEITDRLESIIESISDADRLVDNNDPWATLRARLLLEFSKYRRKFSPAMISEQALKEQIRQNLKVFFFESRRLEKETDVQERIREIRTGT